MLLEAFGCFLHGCVAAAVSYPLRITTIMKLIHISFIIDARQH